MQKKDKVKLFRTIIEALVLILVVFLIVTALTNTKTYKEYDSGDTTIVSGKDNGFIVISYFGVDREGTDTLLSTERLDEQLEALYNLGYVTISQQDILDYFNNGKSLPDKALFLMFEDGRRDTALFASKILEKYNFKATILSYADKFEENDPKFLSTSDLQDLVDSSFWELGTNGYRLSYINCFDRYGRFLGEMTSEEFVTVNEYLERDYNHYLMDYIRDEDYIPTESTEEMTSRITQDYNFMKDIYTKELGEVPMLYCLMHSNTGMFGNNENVSKVNAENIESLFKMNFNRDGFAWNNTESSIYDLTRLQPQSYWSTNHLLMRIWDDLPEEQKDSIVFITGEERYAKKGTSAWTLKQGAVEYKNDNLILTSLPEGEGILTLNDTKATNVNLSVELQGNIIGNQIIYLRANDDLTEYISVSLENNHLIINEKNGDYSNKLFDLDLYELTSIKDRVSKEEDSKSALVSEFNMRGRFTDSASDSLVFYNAANNAKKQEALSVEDGGEEYIPEIEINDLGDTKLEIKLVDDTLHVSVNGQDVTDELNVTLTSEGNITLGSSYGGMGYSQRNVADDVYDGVYKNLVIKDTDLNKTIYDNSLHGLEKIGDSIVTTFNNVLNWFIDKF